MAIAARSSMALRSGSIKVQRPSLSRRSLVARAQTGKEYLLTQPGICAPTGYFDPAGLTSGSEFTVSDAKRFRESELIHGRVAMLAALGWLVQEDFHPLFGGKIGGPAFVHFQKVEQQLPQFWEVLVLAIGITEAYRIGIAYNDPRVGEDKIKAEHMPGNLGFDPLGFYPKDPKSAMELRTKEINNGRLAMIAIAGFAAQEERDHTTILRGLFGGATDPAPPSAFPPYY